MRSPLRLLSCLALCTGLAPAALAQQAPIQQFQGFSLDYLETRSDAGATQLATFSLVSTGPGMTTLSLDGLSDATFIETTEKDVLLSLENALSFGLTAQPGYRITRIEYTGKDFGTIEYGAIPGGEGIEVIDYGHATNGIRIGAAAWPYDSPMPAWLDPWYMHFNVGLFGAHGSFTVVVEPDQALQQQLQLALYAQVQAAAIDALWCPEAACPNAQSSPAYASIWLDDARLTIYTEALPVPEPHAWLMLVLGLFSLRWAGAPRDSR